MIDYPSFCLFQALYIHRSACSGIDNIETLNFQNEWSWIETVSTKPQNQSKSLLLQPLWSWQEETSRLSKEDNHFEKDTVARPEKVYRKQYVPFNR